VDHQSTQGHEALAHRVHESLQKAEAYYARLRKMSTRLLASSIIGSAATTLVTGITAAQGPLVGEDIAGWRLACIIGAVLGFTTTVCLGLNQQLKIGDRLSTGDQCAGRLKALDVAIVVGSRSWDEITKEYEDIVRTYPEPIR